MSKDSFKTRRTLMVDGREHAYYDLKALATRLTANPHEDNRLRVERAYELLYSRPATSAETRLALEFLGKAETPEMPRWEQYAQMLLAANEMFYVD